MSECIRVIMPQKRRDALKGDMADRSLYGSVSAAIRGGGRYLDQCLLAQIDRGGLAFVPN
jgi:hypothetical protein